MSKARDGALNDASVAAALDGGKVQQLVALLEMRDWRDDAVEALVVGLCRVGAARMDAAKAARRQSTLVTLVEELRARGFTSEADRVESTGMQLALAEEGYGRVAAALARSDYSHLPALTRVTAILVRAGLHRAEIAAEIQANLRVGDLVSIQSTVLRDREGRPISVDAALQGYVAAASTVLGLEARRNGWNQNGVLVLPGLDASLTQQDIAAAADGEYLAQAWNTWRRFEERGRFLAGAISAYDEPTASRADKPGSTRHLVLEPSSDDWDLFVAQTRWNELVTLTVEAVRSDNTLRRRIIGLDERPASAPRQFVSVEEALGYYEIWQLLGQPPEAIETSVLGLTLMQWLRGLSVLAVLAKTDPQRPEDALSGLVIVTETFLLERLALGGLDEATARRFIGSASFGTRCRDLYDAPLIRLADGDLVLFGPGILSTNPAGVIRSIWEQARIKFDEKGPAFEAQVLKRLRSLGLAAAAFIGRRDGADYEYDAILTWGDYVFMFECKNYALPGEEPTQGLRFLEKIADGVKQTNRLADALPGFAAAILERTGLDIAGKAVVPCLLNNLPFARPGRTNGCFVYDFAALDRFFASGHLNMKMRHVIEGEVVTEVVPLLPLWSGERPTPEDLMAELEDPMTLRIDRFHARRETVEISLDDTTVALSPEFALEPMSHDSLARLGGLSLSNVRWRVARAKKRLRKREVQAQRTKRSLSRFR